MDKEIKCKKGCCTLKLTTTPHTFKSLNSDPLTKRHSAGIAIVTDSQNLGRKILLTQSYNNLWGVPKGKRELNETLPECASREVLEESGINIPSDVLRTCKKFTFVPGYDKNLTIHIFQYIISTIEYVTLAIENKPDLQPHLHEDSTGFGWININCLKDAIKDNKIRLNVLTKFILKKIEP
jgi:8-oxo-dGTP pyrophosphatase MutT (NUDIX family)